MSPASRERLLALMTRVNTAVAQVFGLTLGQEYFTVPPNDIPPAVAPDQAPARVMEAFMAMSLRLGTQVRLADPSGIQMSAFADSLVPWPPPNDAGGSGHLDALLAELHGRAPSPRPWTETTDDIEAVYRRLTARRHDPAGNPEIRARLRDRPIIEVDLHMHTDHSSDSATPVEVLLATARDQGLGAIAVTDHNEVSGAFEAVEKADRFGVKVIVGEEVKTEFQGEVIGLFLKEKIPRGLSMAVLVAVPLFCVFGIFSIQKIQIERSFIDEVPPERGAVGVVADQAEHQQHSDSHSTRRSPAGSALGSAVGRSTTNSVRRAGNTCSLISTGRPWVSVVIRSQRSTGLAAGTSSSSASAPSTESAPMVWVAPRRATPSTS